MVSRKEVITAIRELADRMENDTTPEVLLRAFAWRQDVRNEHEMITDSVLIGTTLVIHQKDSFESTAARLS